MAFLGLDLSSTLSFLLDLVLSVCSTGYIANCDQVSIVLVPVWTAPLVLF